MTHPHFNGPGVGLIRERRELVAATSHVARLESALLFGAVHTVAALATGARYDARGVLRWACRHCGRVCTADAHTCHRGLSASASAVMDTPRTSDHSARRTLACPVCSARYSTALGCIACKG